MDSRWMIYGTQKGPTSHYSTPSLLSDASHKRTHNEYNIILSQDRSTRSRRPCTLTASTAYPMPYRRCHLSNIYNSARQLSCRT